MEEQKSGTATAERTEQSSAAQAPATQAPNPPLKKRRKKNKTIRRIVAIVIVLAVLAGIAFGIYALVFKKKESKQSILTDVVMRGPIQSTVTGSGVAKAKEAETITLTSGGTVLEVNVKDGDTVKIGDPLYSIDSTDALAAVDTAQKQVNNYQKQLDALYEAANYLGVTADYAGTLLKTSDLKVGDTVAAGTKIAELVDDSKLKLVLYFSYAYKDIIDIGQTASVSVPSTMSLLAGTVTEIDYVNKITPEGSRLFRAVITVDNPGVLTADMGASATLTSGDGETILPYEPGKFAWNRKTDIVTKVGGDVNYMGLMEYARVSAGQTLLRIDAEDNEDQIAALENQLKSSKDALDKAKKNLLNFNAVSPMNGTVLSCSLMPGEQVASGRVAISIADTSVMTVEAQIDELNVSYVKAGMTVTITQWSKNGQEMFMGIVESVSLEGKFENGVSYFPAIVRVDNPEGHLLTGMYIDYSLIASQSDNTLLVPVQAVKYTEAGTCLFVQAPEKPENALDAEAMGLDVPEGFYAVPVTVGLSDNTNAEILDGVTEGTVVFTQIMSDTGSSYMMGGGAVMMMG